jgi:hypothetical protein
MGCSELLAPTSYDPGALPLLSHVLRETWARGASTGR